MKKKILIMSKSVLLCFILQATSFFLDAQTFEWAKQTGGTNEDWTTSVAVDTDGNVYSIGTFEGTVDFDPGTGTFNLTSVGNKDFFVTKLDVSGNFVWAKSFGSTAADEGFGIAVDGSGNVYCTGYYGGTVDFDPGAGTFNVSTKGNSDIFTLKLDALGNFGWVKNMGSSWIDYGQAITVDASNNVYTTGFFNSTVDFDPSAAVYNLTSKGGYDVFITKFDASGNLIWARNMGGNSYEECYGIAIDFSGNILTTGYFGGTADFDPGSGIASLTSAGGYDIFISKLDPSGNYVWAKAMLGSELEIGFSIGSDAADNVYLTGLFRQTVDFDPGANAYLMTANNEEGYIAKLTSSGDFAWAKQIGGPIHEKGRSIAVNSSGMVYTLGDFGNTVDFDPGPSTFTLTAANTDVFISILDTNGEFVNAFKFGGSANDYARSIKLDGANNIITSGGFAGTADFDPGTGTFNFSSFGIWDGFIQKMNSGISALPVVIVPANNSTHKGTNNLNVTAQEIFGATTYTIELNDQPSFTGNSFVRSGANILSFSGLAYSTRYYARVKTNLSASWGAVTSFTTAPPPPAVLPAVYLPANNSTGISINPAVASTTIAGATVYTIELNTAPDFTGTRITGNGASTQTFSRLAFSTTYYSRVKTDVSPDWGPTRSFTTNSALAQTYITSPANNSTNVLTPLSITANNIGASTYTIEISPATDFSSGVITRSGSSPTLSFTGLLYNTKYYARVSTNLATGWGEVRSFTTYNPAPVMHT